MTKQEINRSLSGISKVAKLNPPKLGEKTWPPISRRTPKSDILCTVDVGGFILTPEKFKGQHYKTL